MVHTMREGRCTSAKHHDKARAGFMYHCDTTYHLHIAVAHLTRRLLHRSLPAASTAAPILVHSIIDAWLLDCSTRPSGNLRPPPRNTSPRCAMANSALEELEPQPAPNPDAQATGMEHICYSDSAWRLTVDSERLPRLLRVLPKRMSSLPVLFLCSACVLTAL
jgi:hypothetical protein